MEVVGHLVGLRRLNRERLLQAEVWASFGKPLLLPVGPAWQLRRLPRGDDGLPRIARGEIAMKEGEEREGAGVDGAASLLRTVD